MFCSNCGFKLQELSKFCSSCGNTVSAIPDKNMLDSKQSDDLIDSLHEHPSEKLHTNPIPNPDTSLSEQNIKYSGFWRRVAAILVDTLIFYIPGLIFIYFIDFSTYSNPFFWILGILLSLGYQIYFLKKYGATPGKILVGLKIIPIDLDIKHLDTKTIIKRQIGFFISVLVFFIGFIIQPFNKKKRAMHDFIARTIVIDEKKRSSWMIFAIVIISYIAIGIINLKIAPLINSKLFIDIQDATNQALYEKNDDSVSPDINTSKDLPTSILKNSDASNVKGNLFEIEKEFITNISVTKKISVVQLAVRTHYETRVFDNILKHQNKVFSEVQNVLSNIEITDTEKPKFRSDLAKNIKDAINITLEDLEDFGGVEEVMFTSFEIK